MHLFRLVCDTEGDEISTPHNSICTPKSSISEIPVSDTINSSILNSEHSALPSLPIQSFSNSKLTVEFQPQPLNKSNMYKAPTDWHKTVQSEFKIPPDVHRQQGTTFMNPKVAHTTRSGHPQRLKYLKELERTTKKAVTIIPSDDVTNANTTTQTLSFKSSQQNTPRKRKTSFLHNEGRNIKKLRISMKQPLTIISIHFPNVNPPKTLEDTKNFFFLHLPDLLDFFWFLRAFKFEDIHDQKEEIMLYNDRLQSTKRMNLNLSEYRAVPDFPHLSITPFLTKSLNTGVIARAGFCYLPVDDELRSNQSYLNKQNALNTVHVPEFSPTSDPPVMIRFLPLLKVDEIISFFDTLNKREDAQRKFFYSLFNMEISLHKILDKICKLLNEISPTTLRTYSSALNKVMEYLLQYQQYSSIGCDLNIASTWTNKTFTKQLILQLIETGKIPPHIIHSIICSLIRDGTPHSSIRNFYYGISFWYFKTLGTPLSHHFPLSSFKGMCKSFDLFMSVGGADYITPTFRMFILDALLKSDDYADIAPGIGLGLLVGPRTKEVVKAKLSDFHAHETGYDWQLKKLKNSVFTQHKIIARTNYPINIDLIYGWIQARAALSDTGYFCIDKTGSPMTVSYFQKRHRQFIKMIKQKYLDHTGEDLSKTKVVFYSYRISLICDLSLQGWATDDIRKVTGHAPNSKVLSNYYLRRLDAIIQGGIPNIFYAPKNTEAVDKMLKKIKMLSNLKLQLALKEKLVQECKIAAQHQPEVVEEINKTHDDLLPNENEEETPLQILPEKLLFRTTNPLPNSPPELSSDEDEDSSEPPPNRKVDIPIINLKAFESLPGSNFSPATLFENKHFIEKFVVPSDTLIQYFKQKLLHFLTSEQYMTADKKSAYGLLQVQIQLLSENLFTSEQKQLEKLCKTLGI